MSAATANDSLRASPAIRAALALAFLTFATIGILDARLYALRHQSSTRRFDDVASIPSPGTIRFLSLGHREWAADLLWSAALVYFGESLVSRSQQRFVQQYATTIEGVDPRFRQAYLWGATVSMYNARLIRRESIESAIRHLERGLQEFPDDGEMTYQLGFDYFFELPPLTDNPEARAELRRRGAEYLRRAAMLGYGPPWMALAAAEALMRAGLNDRALDALRDLYLRTDDPNVRAQIEQQMQQMLGEHAGEDPYLSELQRFDAERRAWFPYIGSMLYLFVGPHVPGVARLPAERR